MATDKTGGSDAHRPNDETAVAKSQSLPPMLQDSVTIDLSKLPKEQRDELLVEYTKGIIDLELRARQIGVDVIALDSVLRNMAQVTQELSARNDAVTITNTLENSLGRTEVIMGNTEHAVKGRLTKTQTGETDFRPYLIGLGIAAAAAVVIVLAIGG